MNCQEFQERICSAVDHCLAAEDAEAFEAHARVCPPCRRSLEAELAVKRVVNARLHMVKTPGTVAASIIDTLRDDDRPPVPGRRKPWRLPVAVSGASVALLAVAAFVVFRSPVEQTPPLLSGNVLEHSLANYHRLLRGDIQPEIASSSPIDVARFFEGKTDFPVVMPALRRSTLLGCGRIEYHGARLAHVVMKVDQQVVYMYQACWKTVQAGQALSLPERALAELRSTGWYQEGSDEGTSLVAWTRGSTLCIAVAQMPCDELMSSLTESGSDSVKSVW